MAGFELYAPRAATHRRTWTAMVIVLGFVFVLVAQIVVQIPYLITVFQAFAEAAAHHLPKPKVGPPPPSMVADILNYVLAIGLILVWVRYFERRRPDAIGFNAKPLMRFARGYLIGGGFLVAVVGAIWALGGYKVEGAGFLALPTAAGLLPILSYMVMFVVQGSSEEVWMRGWLMQIVASRHGIAWAVGINSVVFGALHLFNLFLIPPSWGNLTGVANVALFGVFISLYALNERSLWGVCGWHAAWNWLLGLGFGLEVSGLHLSVKPLLVDLMDKPGAAWWLTGGPWGPEGSVVTTLILGGGIAWLVRKGAMKPGDSFGAPQKTESEA